MNIIIGFLCLIFLNDGVSGFRLPSNGFARHAAKLSMTTESSHHNEDTVIVEKKTSLSSAMKIAEKGKSWLKCRVTGVGSCAGGQSMPNGVFESLVDTNDEWIKKRTGIHNRQILTPEVKLREIAVTSAKAALANANMDPSEVDLVIVATSSPDDLFGDAAYVASAIGAKKAAAFDLTAACSGFLYGVVTASQFIQSGAYKNVVVVGADALTRFLDWKDRGTCILFGDGAGAVVLQSTATEQDAGILGFALHSRGEGCGNLHIKYDSNFTALPNDAHSVVDVGNYGKLGMNGPEVYKFAVGEVPLVVNEALINAGLKPVDVDWLLLHQANERIMDHAATELKIPKEKVLKNLKDYGNTSAGSIPLALAEAVKSGKVKKGDIIAIAGFGAGLSWGAAIIRWG